MNNKNSINVSDYILFKYLISTDETKGEVSEILLGKVINQKGMETDLPQYTVQLTNENQELTAETLNVTIDNVLCNLLSELKEGVVYGKQIIRKPTEIYLDPHSIYLYKSNAVTLSSEEISQLTAQLHAAIVKTEDLKTSFSGGVFEFHIKDGDFTKSSFSKKTTKGLDGSFTLFVPFINTPLISNSINYALGQFLWQKADLELKNSWLREFSEHYLIGKITSEDFTDTFVIFLSKKSKDLSDKDQALCKLLVKEIKRIKGLSLQDLKILNTIEGVDYIRVKVLPEVLNLLKIQSNDDLVTPLPNLNAQRSFSLAVDSYIANNYFKSNAVKIILENFLN